MLNPEERLNKIKTKKITAADRESLWQKILVSRDEAKNTRSLTNIFMFSSKKMVVGTLALVVLLGGAGVAFASDDAGPGDFLYPVDLTIEKIQLTLSGDDEDFKLKIAQERLAEITEVTEEKVVPAAPLVTDLSGVTVTEIEVDVFTDKTIVKIEAGDKKYGYVSALKTKLELVAEIAAKYSIEANTVNTLINFEIEDRASRAEDMAFLNKTHSANFSDDEEEDISIALSQLEEILTQLGDSEDEAEIRAAFLNLLTLLGDDAEVEIKKNGTEIKIESDDGQVKIKFESENGNSGSDGSDDDADDSDDSEEADVQEDDSEVFCRGEWRDAEDCDDTDEDSDVDSDDSDDTDDDIEDSDDDVDDSDDDDNSGSDSDDDVDDSADDNSGSN